MLTFGPLLKAAFTISIGALHAAASEHTGVMFYDSDSAGLKGTCGTKLDDSYYWVSVGYPSGTTESNCGKEITIAMTNSDTSVKGYIADECTTSTNWCSETHIQVSKAIMDDLAGSSNEDLDIDASWSF